LKVTVVCVGRPRGVLAEGITEYEERASRYFRLEVVEIREARYRGQPLTELMAEEGGRILARVPAQDQLVALHRQGKMWSSEELARALDTANLQGISGYSFVIGGAFGLSDQVLERARFRLSLSTLTFPHELARLILAEQLYRAGTINRGEPYHKGTTS
jgi:23S rRNA (pseudouridine1915-N3)-methyltransferase